MIQKTGQGVESALSNFNSGLLLFLLFENMKSHKETEAAEASNNDLFLCELIHRTDGGPLGLEHMPPPLILMRSKSHICILIYAYTPSLSQCSY